jgi:hypothetical protein
VSNLEEIREKVVELFTGAAAKLYRLESIDEVGEELIPGVLFAFGAEDPRDNSPVLLQIFVGLHGLASELWERQVRTMMRLLSSAPASGLARMRAARTYPDSTLSIGYVVTEATLETLANPEARGFMAADPLRSYRHLVLLAEALARLHGIGVIHRNLWPGTVGIESDGADDVRLRISRFELSAAANDILRSMVVRHPERRAEVAEVFRRQGLQALACVAPERLPLVFVGADDVDAGAVPAEMPASDIFSLGMIALEWLVGPAPADLVARAFEGNVVHRDAWAAFHAERVEAVRKALDAPRDESDSIPFLQSPSGRTLGRLLLEMIDRDPRSRPSASNVAHTLRANYEGIASKYVVGRLIVAVSPQEFQDTFVPWGIIHTNPAIPAGYQELKEAIEGDLTHSQLVYLPEGYAAVAGAVSAEFQRARFVLVGSRIAYFCQEYEHRPPFGGQAQLVPQALMIRYVVRLDVPGPERQFRQLVADRFAETVPGVEVLSIKSPSLVPSKVRDRPKWTPLLEAVASVDRKPYEQLLFENALNFFLAYQAGILNARRYRFVVEQGYDGGGQEVLLCFDARADERYCNDDPLLHQMSRDPRLRPRFGDFFRLLAGDGDKWLRWTTTARMGASRRESSGDVELVADAVAADPLRVLVKRPPRSRPVPQQGWLQPANDEAAREVLKRQALAVAELVKDPQLGEQLRMPNALARFAERVRLEADSLNGRRPRQLLRRMLETEPFFALHGPPGTGKTKIAAHLVDELMRLDPTVRILVAAQSHDALDNAADRILALVDRRESRSDSIRIRIEPGDHERVDKRMQKYFVNQVVLDSRRDAAETARRYLRDAARVPEATDSSTGRGGVVREFLGLLDESRGDLTIAAELADRVRSSANLVFATCGTATPAKVGLTDEEERYDLVLVEEAAKAWPTELAIPLARGRRWVLIGDHLQLPAYRGEEVERFLLGCVGHWDPTLREYGERRDEYLKVFRTFANLFRGDEEQYDDDASDEPGMPADASRPKAPTASVLERPTGVLLEQRRMAADICRLVSRAFYEPVGKPLKPAADFVPRAHGIRHPAFADRQVVWLDTTRKASCRDYPCWHNEGEVHVVRALFEKLGRDIDRVSGSRALAERLAVLSPYNQQVTALQRALAHYAACVHTVDSFQGREADVVLVSLTRAKTKHARGIVGRLGHMARPERINVMLSRARSLLIVVGDFDHFETAGRGIDDEPGIPFWKSICDTVRDCDGLVDARDVVGSAGD